MNSATFGMIIYFPKHFECCPRIRIYVLVPPLLIYALNNRFWISWCWKFYETKLTEKTKKENWIQLVTLLSVISSRTRIEWCSLHSHVPSLHEEHVRMHFLLFGQLQMYCWYLYFSVKILLKLYSVAWVGAVSNMCDIYIFWYFLDFHMSSNSCMSY